ncbi:unnamed protein product [Linum tenue]|uniref:Uncharacterized protein n=1 Tax=Linum tenue TaxID=586396 RepID=A0AAV0H084_9ROSI|nr:unnamed protein product [Linum tenue]
MGPHGRCLITFRKKESSLHQRWEGFLGERKEGQKAMFIVRRSSIIGHSGMSVQVYKNPGEEYEIEGSCWSRSCTVIDAARRAVVRRSGRR